MARHNILGQLGEQAARDFLIARGLTIREQNWRMNNLEIDIVAYDPQTNLLHIVYLRFYQLKCGIIYDVIIVVGEPGNFELQYIPDAFMPRLRTYR